MNNDFEIIVDWISSIDGLTISPRSAARAFWSIKIFTFDEFISYLANDDELTRRPKGIGPENYKLLADHAVEYLVRMQPVFIGLTCSNGVSFTGRITKQDYAELVGVIEALEIWFNAHKVD